MSRLDANWVGVGAGAAAAALSLPALVVAGLEGDALLAAVAGVWLVVLPVASGATGAIHWIGRRPVSEALAVVPFLPAGALEVAVRSGVLSVPEWATLWATVGTLGGGFLAAVAASHAHAMDLTGGETPTVAWRARADPSRRRTILGAGIALTLVPVAAFALWLVDLLPALPVGSWADLSIFPLTTGIVLATNARRAAEYAAYDAGVRLTYSGAIVSKLVPADRIAGYRVTDDALVIRRRGRLAPALRCAVADLEDREAVTAALDRYVE